MSLTIKTDDVTSGRKDRDPHRRLNACLRGKWVKVVTQTQIVSFIIRLDCRNDREIPEEECVDGGIHQAVLSLPCEQRFLFGIVFSICKVSHMASQSQIWSVEKALKHVNFMSATKIFEVFKEHAQWKPQTGCYRGFFPGRKQN